MKITAAAAVNVGKKRDNNEDNLCFDGVCLTRENREAPFFASTSGEGECFGFCVCDGMGGESSGEEASLIGAEGFAAFLAGFKAQSEPDWQKTIGGYYDGAGAKIRKLSDDLGAVSGCTSANIILSRGKAWFSNSGDSRIYMIHRGHLLQITEDQTFAALLVRSGRMTRAEAEKSRAKNQLTGFLGAADDGSFLKPNLCKPLRLRKGDRFLLCSDGLTDMLTDKEILEAAKSGDVGECVKSLMEKTLEAGAHDNCTIILVEITEKK